MSEHQKHMTTARALAGTSPGRVSITIYAPEGKVFGRMVSAELKTVAGEEIVQFVTNRRRQPGKRTNVDPTTTVGIEISTPEQEGE